MKSDSKVTHDRENATSELSFALSSIPTWLRIHVCSLILLAGMATHVYAMDFKWGNTKNLKGVIVMVGDIQAGDYDKFRKFILANLDEYISSGRDVSLSSNGGNVVESLKLASLLKAMYATVSVDDRERCASACFLLYMGGVERYASFKDTLV